MKSLLTYQKPIVALLAAIVFIFSFHGASDAVTHIHINAVSGTNAPGNGSEAKPYKSITFALLISERAGLPDPWHVHIHPGTYDADPAKPASEREIFPLKLRSKMIFEGTTTADECIIDAQHLGVTQVQMILGIDVEGVTIRNLTIENMKRSMWDGGIGLVDSAGTLETPSSIEGCIIRNHSDAGVGSSIPLVLTGNTFSNNKTQGVWTNKSVAASHNTFIGNGHQGLYIEGNSAGDLTENTFQDNQQQGLYINGTLQGTVSGNIFSGNRNAGLYVVNAFSGDLTENTFSGNTGNGGFYVSRDFTGNLTNNTFTGNTGNGGFFINTFTGNLTHNTFEKNSSGFYISNNFTGDVAHNTFTGNSGSNDGAGFRVNRTLTGNVIHNEFTKNATTSGGGGCWIRVLAGNISHNIFDGNSARWSGAFEVHDGSANKVEVFNNIFFNNTATEVGNSVISRHATSFTNNLFMISDELSAGIAGGATLEVTSPECRFHNNIFAGVKTAIRIWDHPFDLPITHNLFHDIKVGFVTQAGNDLGNDLVFWELFAQNASNNLEGGPLLVDPAGERDFHLQANSPAIDAGTDLYAPADDFDGVARPIGGAVDIGPYEYEESTTGVAMPVFLVWDVNEDGQVSVLDLIVVSQNLGQPASEAPRADINADGTINILDLILVSQHLGERSAPPARVSRFVVLDASLVQTWLALARVENDGSVVFRQGIANLESLLASLLPKETALLANYPNPFNPETWIPYQLAKPAAVAVSIHSADGTLVRTLLLGEQSAGIYQRRSRAAYWDGKNEVGESVASGVYFYTLTAGEFTATRKMLIRK